MLSSEIPARLRRAAGESSLSSILEIVETTSPQSGEFALPLSSAPEGSSSVPSQTDHLPDIPRSLLHELWLNAKAESSGLTLDEFSTVVYSVGTKFNYGFPAAIYPDASQKTDFLQSLRLEDLALATACAFGREVAWQRFLSLYRAPLTQAAVAITGSATLGHELADSLYSEIYGLREVDGERRSPLASYSGRGSLLGWLRTTLAQRHVDHHRRTHRETSLDTLDAPAPQPGHSPAPAELARLTHASPAPSKKLLQKTATCSPHIFSIVSPLLRSLASFTCTRPRSAGGSSGCLPISASSCFEIFSQTG
jgi:DNA-directed RNA polymerase specialized sigma24 family protein